MKNKEAWVAKLLPSQGSRTIKISVFSPSFVGRSKTFNPKSYDTRFVVEALNSRFVNFRAKYRDFFSSCPFH